MEALQNKKLIESSSLFLNLSKHLLKKIDNFLIETEEEKKKKIINIFEDIYGEGFSDGLFIMGINENDYK